MNIPFILKINFLILSEQWNQYIKGWQLLVSNADDFLWNLLLSIAFIVRGIAFIVIIYSLGEEILWKRRDGFQKLVTSFFAFALTTLPFFFAGISLDFPIW